MADYVARALQNCSESSFIWFCHLSLQFLCRAKHFQGMGKIFRVCALKRYVLTLGWMDETQFHGMQPLSFETQSQS